MTAHQPQPYLLPLFLKGEQAVMTGGVPVPKHIGHALMRSADDIECKHDIEASELVISVYVSMSFFRGTG